MGKKKAAHVLEQAADVLVRDGWTQLAFHTENTDGTYSHCALGAIGVVEDASDESRSLAKLALAIHVNPEFRAPVTPMKKARREALNTLMHSAVISGWNDAEGQTKEQVIETLRETAKSVRKS